MCRTLIWQSACPRKFLCWGAIAFLSAAAACSESTNRSPNILFIYLDDLGYGDVSFSNPESKIFPPHIDRLAREGMAFTDAQAPFVDLAGTASSRDAIPGAAERKVVAMGRSLGMFSLKTNA